MASLERALLSLEGLSVGDGFGAALGEFGTTQRAAYAIELRQLPAAPWYWTDDTHMALSIVEVLAEFEEIEQDALAELFAERFMEEPGRGYAGGAARLLTRIANGGDWRRLAPKLFEGGSYGNGGAMRAAPIGGFYHGDPRRAAAEARKAAQITHAHPEGQAGAMAVAAAAAIAASSEPPQGRAFLAEVIELVPDSDTRDGIQAALRIEADDLDTAIKRLGSGWQVSAQDTVPFCLWSAAQHLTDFEAALWQTAQGVGDRDTTCAIVGGIVALSAGPVPPAWVERREPLPNDLAF